MSCSFDPTLFIQLSDSSNRTNFSDTMLAMAEMEVDSGHSTRFTILAPTKTTFTSLEAFTSCTVIWRWWKSVRKKKWTGKAGREKCRVRAAVKVAMHSSSAGRRARVFTTPPKSTKTGPSCCTDGDTERSSDAGTGGGSTTIDAGAEAGAGRELESGAE
jgi:hypothetical protein